MLTKILQISTTLLFTLGFMGISMGQNVRPYGLVFSQNLKGGTAIFGNTSMHSLNALGQVDSMQMNQSGNPNNGVGGIGHSQYGNDTTNMQPAKVDLVNTVIINATTADLVLPAGVNTIKFARLYWGGRVNNTFTLSAPDTLRKVKIRKGNSGAYANVLAAASSIDYSIVTGTESVYQTYVDITNYIQTNGAGTYTVADVPSNAGSVSNGGNYAGWCIIIAYENLAQPLHSVRIYDGFVPVYNAGASVSQTITLNGLNVPSNPIQQGDAILSTMVWEGDANLGASPTSPEGDYIKINNIAVSNATNPVTNFWNSSITKNGAFVTTKNPNYFNQKGIDIDELEVGTGYGIVPNANTVNFEFGTESDRYFPSIFAFSIRMKDPILILNKTVTDANNNGILESEEIITYTLTGSNIGAGTAFSTVLVDSIPSNVTYVPGSIKIEYAPNVASPTIQTDAAADDYGFVATHNGRNYVQVYLGTNATFVSGGEVAQNQTYQVTFKVKAAVIPGSVINIARITATSQNGAQFTDDGTAIIGPTGGPVAVTLANFYGKNQKEKNNLFWITTNEINNDYFIVERSNDGCTFAKIGKVEGIGFSASVVPYQFEDVTASQTKNQFYRLKMVNKNGNETFSKIINLNKINTTSVNISTYPNPFIDKLTITVSANEATQTTYKILTYDGKEILNKRIQIQKGSNDILVTDLQQLQKGQYLFEIIIDGKKLISKVMKY